MKHLLFVALLLASSANAEDKRKWSSTNKPLKEASYLVYGGEPGDRKPPSNTDRKLAIAIRGQAAKEILTPSDQMQSASVAPPKTGRG